MENRVKKAMTLAEIMVVITIVGIIIGIFLAMPKKDVGKMDSAKYYIAYSMLKRLQEEQVAQNGTAVINNTYCNQVNNWLNTTENLNCPASTTATITNGMIIDWSNIPTITVNIDGQLPCVANANCHNFVLTANGQVIPQNPAANNMDWISFQVFTIGPTGNKVLQMDGNLRETYINAVNHYNACVNAGNDCFMQAVEPLK